MIAWPLGLFDCCGVSDGAAAAIITRADLAKKFRPDPIYIKAAQICRARARAGCSRGLRLRARRGDVPRRPGAPTPRPASRTRARRSASPRCTTASPSPSSSSWRTCSSARAARAGEDIEAGTFDLDGELPVNTDGGLKCFGHPIGASGLRMIYEVYKQLQEKAGPRQVKNPRLGLTHNLGGEPGSATVSVIIAGNELG